MRDKLIHDYFGFSAEVVWKTITEDFPIVKPEMMNVLTYIENKEKHDVAKK